MKEINFKETNTIELFFRIFIPTLLGMVFTTSLVVCDGIFVGRGVGSDALAAINIAMPLYMIATGIGLMFGIGASVTASIHLSRNRVESANLCLTQSLTVSTLFIAFLSGLIMIFDEQVVGFLGGSKKLLPLVLEYMHIFVSFIFLQTVLTIGQFMIRLDGSPNYSMMCNVIPAIINITLDYIFIFMLGWGLSGAAWAAVISMMIGTALFLFYMFKYNRILHLQFGSFSYSNLRSVSKGIINTANIGFSALLSELAMSTMFLMGNHIFIRRLGEDGVAAFSVVCYLFPLIYMAVTAITQSSQPIISFNLGNTDWMRISKTLRLSLLVAASISIFLGFSFMFFGSQVVSLFLKETTKAHEIAVYGMPYFAAGFIFFALNMVLIGYYQSIKRAKSATFFTILRGFVLMIACFLVLPILFEIKGIWIAVPSAELLAFLAILLFHIGTRKNYITRSTKRII